jgi:hypothetical protein
MLMSQNPITNDQLADQFATVHALTTPQRLNLLIEYLDVLAFVPSLTFAAFLERKTELLDTPSNTDVLNFYMPTKLGEHTFTATQRVDALRLYATYRGLIGPDDPIVDLAAFLREGLIADGIPVPEPKAAKPKRAPKKPKEEAPSATVVPEPEPAPPPVVHGEPRGTVVFQTAVLPQIRELLQRDTRTSNDLGAVLVHSCVDIVGVGDGAYQCRQRGPATVSGRLSRQHGGRNAGGAAAAGKAQYERQGRQLRAADVTDDSVHHSGHRGRPLGTVKQP